jgi:hypothetical protein
MEVVRESFDELYPNIARWAQVFLAERCHLIKISFST